MSIVERSRSRLRDAGRTRGHVTGLFGVCRGDREGAGWSLVRSLEV